MKTPQLITEELLNSLPFGTYAVFKNGILKETIDISEFNNIVYGGSDEMHNPSFYIEIINRNKGVYTILPARQIKSSYIIQSNKDKDLLQRTNAALDEINNKMYSEEEVRLLTLKAMNAILKANNDSFKQAGISINVLSHIEHNNKWWEENKKK